MAKKIPKPKETSYNCVLLHPELPIVFLGTKLGCVEVWDISTIEKKAELRYLIINKYGDQIPVEDPIVHLTATVDYSLVYAFMGTAAYCIDVQLLTIIQQIPISEKTISGSISNTGEIVVITEPGYLSRWSQKFVERIAWVELNFKIPFSYMCHDYDEERVIIVTDNDNLIVTNLGNNPYFIQLKYPGSTTLLEPIWIDKTQKFTVIISKNGDLIIEDGKETLDNPEIHDLIRNGKLNAEKTLREFVQSHHIKEEDKIYIDDYRLQRLSRERYVAELNKSSIDTHHEFTIGEDEKTLKYAMEEYLGESILEKSRSISIIQKIADRNKISLKYLLYAFRLRQSEEALIEFARLLEKKSKKRQDSINRALVQGIVSSFLILILSSILSFNTISHLIIALLLAFSIYNQIHWNTINKNPRLISVKEYLGLLIFSLITSLVAAMFYFLKNLTVL